MTEKQTSQLRNDLERLRSSSPAIKRPASDMGAQDREEHTVDVDMDRGSSPAFAAGADEQQNSLAGTTPKAKQIDTGSRHLRSPSSEIIPPPSNPKVASQITSSETESGSLESLLPTASHVSTAATSVSNVPIAAGETPTIDEQVAKVMGLMDQELQDNQKGYLVSMKWLSRVQSRSSHILEGQKFDKSASEGEIGPIDNSDLAMVMEGLGDLKDEAGEPYVALRPGVTMNEDFLILPQEAWDLIVQWYGNAPNSPIITRYAHNTTEDKLNMNCQYELQPPVYSFLKVPAGATLQAQRDANTPPPRFLASRHIRVNDWLKKAKGVTSTEISSKVRIWKYLGGLKGVNGSGILTPAASRSASPAPGVELVASAGERMLLDVIAFSNLSDGDQKELVEFDDQTANSKYNGKVTLQTLGLGKDEVIVLEEQIGGPAGGEWPSETSKGKLSVGRGLTGKGKNSAVGGRSSPAPTGSIMTRGRQRRDGRPKGITGLTNLGNTCYMNSALQCIRSVEELTVYFLQDHYKKDFNPANPLSHNGDVAKAYGNLLKKMYEDNISSFSPNNFKSVIGRYGPNFSGYGQQDSQEFLLFLLDGLAEDLSRIHKKPYIEKPDSTDEMVHDHEALKAFADKNWEIYKARNDSVVTDLFSGMYKSTVTCPACAKVSIIFDPYNSLTLQLPIENNWQREVTYFPFQRHPIRIDIDIDKNATFMQLKEFVAKRVNADPKLLIVAEAYKNRFYKTFENSTTISEANPGNNDIICVYEIDSMPTNYNPNKPKKYNTGWSMSRDSDEKPPDIDSPKADQLLVLIFNRLDKQTNSGRVQKSFFGAAGYIVLDREDQKSYDRILKKVLGYVVGMTTRDLFTEDTGSHVSAATPEDSDTVITNEDGQSSDSNVVHAHSVEGEDGLVDVRMGEHDESTNEDKPEVIPSPWPGLRPGEYTPAALQGLFNMKLCPTTEAVPTGWNSIDEHKEYDTVQSRVPRIVTHRPARRNSLTMDGARSGSTSSDEDAVDIPYDAPAAKDQDSDADSNSSLPSVSAMFGEESSKRKPATYSAKDRRKAAQAAHIPEGSELQSLVRPGEIIILDWNEQAHDALFGRDKLKNREDSMRGRGTWDVDEQELFHDEELQAKRDTRKLRKKHGISLDDCLNETGKSETLSENNAWYCPRCKEHRRADKKLELWKIPDILVMHLKRFSANRSFRDKLEILVDYPVEGLDMSNRVIEPEPGKSMIYDLIAVDMHYGGLGGGHYTAYAQNFYNKAWYEYNDQSASARPNAQAVVTNAAYLLFYRRRSDHPLGGPVLEDLLKTSDEVAESEDPQIGSREPSPQSGEGRRLGDSSHNGSSSAYNAAGQVHRVGDGGLATSQSNKGKRNHGVHLEDGSPLKSVEMTNDEEDLPSYSASSRGLGYTTNMGMDEDEGIEIEPNDYRQHRPSLWNSEENPWDLYKSHGPCQMSTVPPGSPDEDLFQDADGDGGSTKVEGSDRSSLPEYNQDYETNDHVGADFMETPPGSVGSADWPRTPPLDRIAPEVHDLMDTTGGGRSARESAPPPDGMEYEDAKPIHIIPPTAMDEDDDDLPVMELHAGDA